MRRRDLVRFVGYGAASLPLVARAQQSSARRRLGVRLYAKDGGLVSCGMDTDDLMRRAFGYADRIFRGARPGDLPIQAPTKFELVFNLKSARDRPRHTANGPDPCRRGDRMSRFPPATDRPAGPLLQKSRAFCALLIGTLTTVFTADPAVAQQAPKQLRIGYLDTFSTPAGWTQAFRQTLTKFGHVENQTIIIDWRFAQGRVERLPQLASELIGRRPTVIVAETPSAVRAARNATATIPIVMILVSDPVGLGLVKSLARPGGNVTGLSTMSAGLAGKRLELLAQIAPGLTRVGVIGSIANRPAERNYRQLEAIAGTLGLQVELFKVRRPEDFDAAFGDARRRVGGVIVLNNALVRTHREVVAAAAARHLVPAVHPDSAIVAAGGLLSYAADIPDLHRRAAVYVDKILKGANPTDLPVEQPTKFTLAVNLRTARALGLTVPKAILLRADKVIE